MKLRVYLDTSVPSAYYDDRAPDRQAETRAFWERLGAFETSVSTLTINELMLSRNPALCERLLRLVSGLNNLEIPPEGESLADIYLREGIFTETMRNDALHVATAVVTRQDILVSWNFRHLVNRLRRARINEVNLRHGYPTLEILAPPEV